VTLFQNLKWLLLGLGFALSSCTSLPDGITPISGFQSEKYLGTWYEVARLDHSFERGLSDVTATYNRREDGGIEVINRGFKGKSDDWKEANGKAYFVGDSDVGHLKVSFFGPFYGSYVIFDLDDDYRHAFIAGNSRKNLWLLSRTPGVSDALKAEFLEKIDELGFDREELIWVSQERNMPRAVRE